MLNIATRQRLILIRAQKLVTLMANKPLQILLLAVFSIALAACGKPDTPEQVAAKFWTAIESGDADKVKEYVSAKDKITLQSLEDVLAINSVMFGKIIIDGANSSVDTTITLAGNRATDLPISTHLMLENEKWVVDYERTMHSMVAAGQVAAVINQFKDIGTAIKKGIGQSVNEFQKVIPEIERELSDMERQIAESVPELKFPLRKIFQRTGTSLERGTCRNDRTRHTAFRSGRRIKTRSGSRPATSLKQRTDRDRSGDFEGRARTQSADS